MNREPKLFEKSKESYSIFAIILRLFPDIFKVCPQLSALYIVISIAHGLSFGLIVKLQQVFFDDTSTLFSGNIPLKSVVSSLIIVGVGYAANQVLSGAAGFIPKVIVKKTGGYLTSKIHMKISELPPIIFEDTRKLDNINKAEQGKNNALSFTFAFMDISLFYLPYFTFMALYLYSLQPRLIFSVLLVFVPAIISQVIRARLFSGSENETAPLRRAVDYYEECLVSRDYFKETRLLGVFRYFKNKYTESLSSLQKLQNKALKKNACIELGITIASILGYMGIIYLLFTSLMNRHITIGAFAAVYASLGWMFDFMDELVNYRISDMAKNIGTVRNYLNFLELEPPIVQDADLNTNLKGLEVTLENVNFSYPLSNKQALKNISFTVRSGETIAIVGENGSGKSTLVKLLTGIYLPDNGKVYYNGIDISNINRNCYSEKVSAVFQKYQRYQISLRENISISSSELCKDTNRLTAVCLHAGVAYNNEDLFPDGYETILSREFGGVDLSLGQWQRIAIARALFRENDLIILDEPTSSIDPYEETRMYNIFSQITKEKTTVLVTHRLGSVKLADRILVMKAGEIVQSGSHNELITQEGEYLRLYQQQQQWYSGNLNFI